MLIAGNRDHPEVQGILSHVRGEKHLFSTVEELENLLKHSDFWKKTPIFAAQTTQNLSEWKKSQKIIKNLCTNAKKFDTICSVTENRQTEARELASTVDMMVVLGGMESSNTHQLYRTAKEVCPFTVMAEDVKGIPPIPENIFKMGITAGA
jgi:4-hydroxy-3-methylbut-2-enyl diphosphate reductase